MKKSLSIIAIFFISTLVAHASDVSIIAPKSITNSSPFSVPIDLNTSGNAVNSFDISITYPDDVVSFSGYKEDGSIKKLWVVAPHIESGAIHFSGIIPGGVDGLYDPDKIGLQPITLVKLIFTPRSIGSGYISISNSKILQNDGRGTALPHEVHNATISVSEISEEGVKDTIEDKDSPLPFEIGYIVEGFFSRTPSMVIFSTTDVSSGVEKYQLKTGRGWVDVASPLPAPRGLVDRSMNIRAVDFYGNMQESHIDIPGFLSTTSLFVILLIVVLYYFIFRMIKRRL